MRRSAISSTKVRGGRGLTDLESSMPAQVLVNLLVRLRKTRGRRSTWLPRRLAHLPEQALTCPGLAELCQQRGRMDRLAEVCSPAGRPGSFPGCPAPGTTCRTDSSSTIGVNRPMTRNSVSSLRLSRQPGPVARHHCPVAPSDSLAAQSRSPGLAECNRHVFAPRPSRWTPRRLPRSR